MLYAAADSGARDWARGFAWLWRLGEVGVEPAPGAVGFGLAAEAEALAGLVADRRLRGAVIAVGDATGAGGPIPAGRRVEGRVRFEGGGRVRGGFTVFAPGAGSVVVRSSGGDHAITRDGVLYLGHDPATQWGDLSAFWAPEAVAGYLRELGVELSLLPPVGVLRLDDVPATAQLQLEGRAHSDERQARRIAESARAFAAAGAVLNVAVVAAALDSDREVVPLDAVYPRSVMELRAAIDSGVYEPVCHGYLHLDPDAFAAGEIEFREFQRIGAERVAERLDRALDWQRAHLAEPSTFVAPAWSYGPAGDAEAARRGLVRWYRARPGPVLEGGRLHETLIGELPGIDGLDYSPLQRLAKVGIPPMIAMHGALLDSRLGPLRNPRGLISLARLFVRRDVRRLIALDGIRWVGVAEFIDALSAHAEAQESASTTGAGGGRQ